MEKGYLKRKRTIVGSFDNLIAEFERENQTKRNGDKFKDQLCEIKINSFGLI